MTAVLADSGPLLALAFDADQYHEQALADLVQLDALRWRVKIVISTVAESYALVLRRAEPTFAFTWFDSLRESADFVFPSEDEYLAGAQLIQRYRDQPITLADGILATMSRQLNLPVWTFDHHFDVMRIERWR